MEKLLKALDLLEVFGPLISLLAVLFAVCTYLKDKKDLKKITITHFYYKLKSLESSIKDMEESLIYFKEKLEKNEKVTGAILTRIVQKIIHINVGLKEIEPKNVPIENIQRIIKYQDKSDIIVKEYSFTIFDKGTSEYEALSHKYLYIEAKMLIEIYYELLNESKIYH